MKGRFGANPRVIGRAVNVDGEAYTVIGVMPGVIESAANAEIATIASGNEFCSAAGRIESLTTNHNISPASRRRTLLSACGFPNEDMQKCGTSGRL